MIDDKALDYAQQEIEVFHEQRRIETSGADATRLKGLRERLRNLEDELG